MKFLRIKDKKQKKKETFSGIAHITRKVADKTLCQLEKEGVFVFPEMLRDAEDITRDQRVLQSVNDSYQTGNVMGFLGCGQERLVISSRFSGQQDYFLYLIHSAHLL